MNIVQGDGNADFSDLATLVHSRLAGKASNLGKGLPT